MRASILAYSIYWIYMCLCRNQSLIRFPQKMTITMIFTLSGNWNSILASKECAVKLRTIQIQTRLGTSLHTNSLLGQPPHFYHHKKDIFSISTEKSRGWASDQLTIYRLSLPLLGTGVIGLRYEAGQRASSQASSPRLSFHRISNNSG